MRTLIPEEVSGVGRALRGMTARPGKSVAWRWVGLVSFCLVWLVPVYFSHRLLPLALGWDALVVVLFWFDLALTSRTLLLLVAGVTWLVPAFFHPGRLWFLGIWDLLLLGFCVFDAVGLPKPERFTVTRRFLDSPQLGKLTLVEVEVVLEASSRVTVDVLDGLDTTMLPVPVVKTVVAYPRDPVRTTIECWPGRRGDLRLGDLYLHYRGLLGLVERWAVVPLAQGVRVFPALDEGAGSELYLMRARQIEMQKRRLRLRGIGREFESLRDYQAADELRNISWTSTARRGKLITRQFTTERSQQVWVVLDAGRLSRTAFALRKRGGTFEAESELEAAENLQVVVTQLDTAATAAVMLAEAVGGSGDKCGLLTYGRAVQQQLLPGAGASHLRSMIDQLSQTRAEAAEANHLGASARLKQLQRRRGMVIWVTEIADSVGRPEVVSAVADLARRHLVLVVLLKHPELESLAGETAKGVSGMYATAAAREMLTRRVETIAALRRQGVLVVESEAGEVGMRAINGYLEVKAKGLI